MTSMLEEVAISLAMASGVSDWRHVSEASVRSLVEDRAYWRDLARAAIEAMREPTEGERYRHVKRGTVYEVIGVAELQNALGDGCGEGDRLVIYRGEEGQIWAREQCEFHDGRFIALNTQQTGEGE